MSESEKTLTQSLVEAGIQFSCTNKGDMDDMDTMTDIPRVQDVLYVLRLSEENNYKLCMGDYSIHISNVYLVAATIGSEVLDMEPYDEAEACRIIAQAIITLCPKEARCFSNDDFIEARKMAGQNIPQPDTSHDDLLQACGCKRCQSEIRNRAAYFTDLSGEEPRCRSCGHRIDDPDNWCDACSSPDPLDDTCHGCGCEHDDCECENG